MIYALLCALCWAGFDTCRKQLSKSYDAPLMSVIFSALVLPIFVCMWLMREASFPSSNYYFVATASGLMGAIGSVSFIRALSVGKLAIVLPMMSFTPVCSAILAWLWLSDPLSFNQSIGIVGIAVSSFLVLGGRFKTNEKGIWQALLAALCWGFCIVLDKFALQYGSKEFHAAYITFIILIATALLLRVKLDYKKVKEKTFWWLLSVVLLACALILQFIAITQLQPGIVEGLKRAIGITSALMIGVFAYKEQISKGQLCGVLCVLLFSGLLVR
ncbi:EamA family transporter [Pseudoalteromonas sp. S16_S37]|uniref:EamA family transporter n=1 Tax=Pseudoalteromonas sp. S16_S37 TaxID=2720228 RepID=UPI001680D009|nr:EamA family transporter [Pseudoalteromonas sp. S16_S37]MBD1583087.1 DMT family transporter [Pseudoalteromonas sp. S16_S37]